MAMSLSLVRLYSYRTLIVQEDFMQNLTLARQLKHDLPGNLAAVLLLHIDTVFALQGLCSDT